MQKKLSVVPYDDDMEVQTSVHTSKVLLEHNHIHSFTYTLFLAVSVLEWKQSE